ncbi:MAG: 5-oxoprolinase/urea amidolyase family protein [Cellulomonas sp.]|uniref:5-oxoprolinase subunit B/C family protein n=1 Tax=Cellulomonas sp. TaxID=40001 RepID=UPI0019F4BDED|nr:urea amidolyase family protein [Cellulomonas sp.]MBF0687041.1 5-oxoprolinase/urea amidolyase family protein [Cellulomonas sp.]
MASRLLSCGEDGVLVEVADLAAVRALDAALRAAHLRDVVDVVPAARTVLVRGAARSRRTWAAAVARVAADVDARWDDAGAEGMRGPAGAAGASGGERVVEVPVVYDGTDLQDVARETGLSDEDVVSRHLAGGSDGYRVAFGGFAPGFAYVVGLDPRLHVPRLASPRTRVPAGAVAVAGEFTAVYPAASPGGWRLLGTTDVAMFDVTRGREGAALLAPGDVVRFVRRRTARVTTAPGPRGVSSGAQPPRAAPAARTLTVVATGPLTLVEDAGRPGLAAVGVPRSGAADPDALRRANRLVGNRADAAGLEVVLGGLVLRCGTTTAVAVTGAHVAAQIDGVPVPHATAVRAPAGSTLRLAAPRDGLRTWLAVRGGIDVPSVLGSRSADVLSGLGPRAVRPGDVLPLGSALDGLPEPPLPGAAPGDGEGPARTGEPSTSVVLLDAADGPRLDHLDVRGRAGLWSTVWQVDAASNRVAVRLTGAPLTRVTRGELASEGLVVGAVQVPHDGRPVLFGPDHPVTGGYPVVAVLTRAAQARAAQLRPGQQVRLRRVEPAGS